MRDAATAAFSKCSSGRPRRTSGQGVRQVAPPSGPGGRCTRVARVVCSGRGARHGDRSLPVWGGRRWVGRSTSNRERLRWRRPSCATLGARRGRRDLRRWRSSGDVLCPSRTRIEQGSSSPRPPGCFPRQQGRSRLLRWSRPARWNVPGVVASTRSNDAPPRPARPLGAVPARIRQVLWTGRLIEPERTGAAGASEPSMPSST